MILWGCKAVNLSPQPVVGEGIVQGDCPSERKRKGCYITSSPLQANLRQKSKAVQAEQWNSSQVDEERWPGSPAKGDHEYNNGRAASPPPPRAGNKCNGIKTWMCSNSPTFYWACSGKRHRQTLLLFLPLDIRYFCRISHKVYYYKVRHLSR